MKIEAIEIVTKHTNDLVVATQDSLANTNTVIETNKLEVMKILLTIQESQRLAQELATKQFSDLQATILKIVLTKDGNGTPNEENAMEFDTASAEAPGVNHSNCDGRSALGSITNF